MILSLVDTLAWEGAIALGGAIQKREVSAREALEYHLERIDRHNSTLNAVVISEPDEARKAAEIADEALARGTPMGPLHGVPMTVKDGIAVAGMRTTGGHPALAKRVPRADATAVGRLRAAGAVIVGHTNVPLLLNDFQTNNALFGRTNNPWNLERTCGGSSGGSAAAVAAGMTPLEIGSDLGGSIRVPAAFCGVYGLKPTERRVPVTGHVADVAGDQRVTRALWTIGPMARTLDDLELALRLISGPDHWDSEVAPVPLEDTVAITSLDDLRFAWVDSLPRMRVAADIRTTLERLASELGAQGARVANELPEDIDPRGEHRLWAQLIDALEGEPDEAYSVRRRADWASLDWYLTALDRRDRIRFMWDRFFEDHDALLMPVAMCTAFPHLRSWQDRIPVDGELMPYGGIGRHTALFNLAGLPSMSIPAGADGNGLPVAVQIVGPRWSEIRLLAIARALEGGGLLPGFCRPPGY